MDQLVDSVLRFIAENRFWAGPVVSALAFAESMAFRSLRVPVTAMIIAAGALVGSGTLDPWIVIPWGIAGAAFGDAVSYWIGRYFDDKVPKIWPFRDNPDALERGHRFFERWGVLSVFIGRFFGPLRAVIPVVAGIMDMPQLKFQIANVVSAVVWLPALMVPGIVAGTLFADVAGLSEKIFIYVFLAFIPLSLIFAFVAWRRRGPKTKTPARQPVDTPEAH